MSENLAATANNRAQARTYPAQTSLAASNSLVYYPVGQPMVEVAQPEPTAFSFPDDVTFDFSSDSDALFPLGLAPPQPPQPAFIQPPPPAVLAPAPMPAATTTHPHTHPPRRVPTPVPQLLFLPPGARRVVPLVRIGDTVVWLRPDLMRITVYFNWSPHAETEAYDAWE
ncbi:hypothetical protein BC834DRAFT_844314 [Gloeopeniophorella convolvens]|nr:hypothetical protein BC834DRAFT_844314 [Gloeopeniophorella convolvens]